MGLLDYLFGESVDPAQAHNAALRGLLATAGDKPDPSTNAFGLPSGQFPGSSQPSRFWQNVLGMPDLSAMREQTPLAPAGSNIPTIDPMPLFGRTAAQIADNIRNDRYAPQAPQPETPNEYYDQQPGPPRLSGSPNSPLAKWMTTVENTPSAAPAVSAPASQAPASAVPVQQPADAPAAAQAASSPVTHAAGASAAEEPSLLGRLAAASRAYHSGGGLFSALGAAAGVRGPAEIETMNATAQALNKKLGPGNEDLVRAAVLNPAIMQQLLPVAFPPKPPAVEKIKEDERLLVPQRDSSGNITGFTDATPGEASMTGKTVSSRVNLAPSLGLKPGTQAWQAYVANGKVPDVVPDHAAIRDADTQVQHSQALIDNLNQALELSKKAYSGPGAENRGYFTSTLVPGGHPNADATGEYTNLIKTSILPGLKTLFPQRVTNTDLAYVEKTQGAVDYSQNVREAILKRAIRAAEDVKQEKTAAAKALREGTYYKPEGTPEVISNPTGQPQQQVAADPTIHVNPQTGEKIRWDGRAWVPMP